MNLKTVSALVIAMIAMCGVSTIFLADDSSAEDHTGNTYSVALVEGAKWEYSPSYSLTGVTTTLSGTAAAWLTVSSGKISGNAPTVASGSATYSLTIKATTAQPVQTAYQYVDFTVYDTLTASGTASKTVYTGQSVSLTSAANLTGVTWTATNLPAGLSISASSGAITGSATAAGDKTATITATHSASGQSKSYTIAFKVSGVLAATSAANMYCVNGVALPTVSTADNYYRLTANLSGVTFALKSGSVSGVTVNSDGTITGTPTSMGDITLVITMTETATGQTVDFTLVVHIVAPLSFGSVPSGAILVTPG